MNRHPEPASQVRRSIGKISLWSTIALGLLLLLLLAPAARSARAQESAPTGRTFSLPVIRPHAVDDPNAFVYTVRLGEYWILIARKFGVSYTELRAANSVLWALRGELIWPGDEMAIPGLSAADQWQTLEYTVAPGDSWYAIASRFGVNYWDLRLDNLGLWRRRAALIQPGDQMQIVNPKSTDAAAPTQAESATPAPTAATQPASTQSASAATATPAPAPENASSTPTAQAAAPGALPTAAPSSPPFRVTNPPADGVIYSVRPGDSWFGIASRFGITFEQLRSVNPELWALRGQDIRPADEMIIPAHGSPPPPLEIKTVPDDKGGPIDRESNYTVVEGDSWASVAGRAGISEEELKAANVDVAGRELVSGDSLRIP